MENGFFPRSIFHFSSGYNIHISYGNVHSILSVQYIRKWNYEVLHLITQKMMKHTFSVNLIFTLI